ncbi:hypothetical protein ACOMHN_044743 [Nucella lapillus]
MLQVRVDDGDDRIFLAHFKALCQPAADPQEITPVGKRPSLSEVMATLNSINSSLNSKMNGMNASLNDKMDGVK